jgi:phage terminase large subunit-like protein
MSSHFESKRILVNPLLDRRSEFWNEWVQFPRGQHDDALDSVEIVVRNVIGKPIDIHAWELG